MAAAELVAVVDWRVHLPLTQVALPFLLAVFALLATLRRRGFNLRA